LRGPSIVPFSLPMRPRVAPNPQSSSCAGDGASSCLASRILQRFCKRSFGLPRLFASPAPPPIEAPGCPESSLFRLAYGESSGRPENSLLPAWPWAQTPGCPGSRSFWPASGSVSGLPRIPSPLAAPFDGSSGCPKSLTLRQHRLRILGSPRFLRLRLFRSTSTGRPVSCFCGWADLDFPAQLELCILDARPRMNLRVQSGLAYS
jgi:hypothetical protein